ncbi:GAF domain-containing sensor histidine kinase [Leptospira selangorensis]|uniref:GAF domain-containing sensor histidine kinase n=1 Tax=Leptospira selangorensis TaxID=2484982 RepID=A0A4R9FTV0_9LEPT|nr:GAF domain-containing sensor histidine kinase [Leptospira selangorensis]TGK02063.1 GAF domain-containing sensor histidine kinase [Leptospira selangorensis]TGM11554.1 GAF domain-containing sensor histidine kinase [Leptospira selangorensis]TGM21203.1 GAF domain-containing sensor histidine kinase [Leptospira selangorensis]
MQGFSNIDQEPSYGSFSEPFPRESEGFSNDDPIDRSNPEDQNTKDELLKKISVLNLLQQVATAANEANDVESVLQFSVDRICAIADWKLGLVCLVLEESERPEYSSISFSREEKFLKEFRNLLRSKSKKEESILTERVRSGRKPILLENFPSYLKGDIKELSLKAGVEEAIGIPILVKENLVGVLEFYSGNKSTDPSFFEAVSHISSQIGRVFERRDAENHLKTSGEQLRALSARLQEVREEERLLVAREIHDELGQLLTVLKIDLTLLKNNFQKSKSSDSVVSELLSMIKVADSGIESVQRIATELRPLILEDLGLLEGIEWYAKDFEKRTGIRCEIRIPVGILSLEKDASIALFRIFQEALTNAARHSKASSIQVSCLEEGRFLILKIQDNGIGIDPKKMNQSKSLGLIGMRERAVVLGGEVSISGGPGKGASVIVKIPISNRNKEDFL